MSEIKISDLSIGDWVAIDGRPKRISSVLETPMGGMVRCQEQSITAFVEHISPIPLTPEILDKNGFVIVDESADFQLYGSPECSIFFTKGTVRYRLETPQASVVCWNVHELQHALRLAGVGKDIEV